MTRIEVTVHKTDKLAVLRTIQSHGQKLAERSIFKGASVQTMPLAA